ncbi:MAG: Rid family hydrolase [Pseudomonadota bacterium]
MIQPISSTKIYPPFSNYSHGVLVPQNSQLLFCSGQLGIAADGNVPEGCEAQSRLCFANIASVLEAAGMALADIVRINAYVTGRDHLPGYMAVRNELFGEPYPASTLMIVSGFARPEFLVEIEAVAANQT